MKDFRDIKAWSKAHQLAIAVYETTAGFPKDEQYGLTSQIRRAAGSVPANIAEGCGRDGDAELSRFCRISMGSASELEYHLMLARDLKYLKTDEHKKLEDGLIEVKRMLATFIRKLRAER